MTDFSHLVPPLSPHIVLRSEARGYSPTDEMLFGAIGNISPPLLSKSEVAMVELALFPRRGRRKKDLPSLKSIIERIESSDRDDVPKAFLDLLATRLGTGKRYADADAGKAFSVKRRRADRKMFFRYTYREMYERLDGRRSVEHPIFGMIEVPKDVRTPSAKALKMAHWVLREKLLMDPPSRRRMMNIISERNSLPFS